MDYLGYTKPLMPSTVFNNLLNIFPNSKHIKR